MTLFHKALKDSEEKLTRIRLVKFTADVLCNLSILASAEQITENGRRVQWDQLYPNLDGYILISMVIWLSEQHSEQCPDYLASGRISDKLSILSLFSEGR